VTRVAASAFPSSAIAHNDPNSVRPVRAKTEVAAVGGEAPCLAAPYPVRSNAVAKLARRQRPTRSQSRTGRTEPVSPRPTSINSRRDRVHHGGVVMNARSSVQFVLSSPIPRRRRRAPRVCLSSGRPPVTSRVLRTTVPRPIEVVVSQIPRLPALDPTATPTRAEPRLDERPKRGAARPMHAPVPALLGRRAKPTPLALPLVVLFRAFRSERRVLTAIRMPVRQRRRIARRPTRKGGAAHSRSKTGTTAGVRQPPNPVARATTSRMTSEQRASASHSPARRPPSGTTTPA
jgi:hypothetical protein